MFRVVNLAMTVLRSSAMVVTMMSVGGDVFHDHQVLDSLGKEHPPDIRAGKNSDEPFVGIHHRKIMLFGLGKIPLKVEKGHVLGNQVDLFHLVHQVFDMDALENIHKKVPGMGR